MDSDLQNSCSDIPKLIKELNNGYDVVSGWRKERRDGFFTRVLPSKLQIGLYQNKWSPFARLWMYSQSI